MFDTLVRFANRVHVLGCPGVASVHLTPDGATPDDDIPASGAALDSALTAGPSPVPSARPWSVPDWDDDPAPASAAAHGVPSATAPSRTPPGQPRRPLDGWPSVGRSNSSGGGGGGGSGGGNGGGGNAGGGAGKVAAAQAARHRTRDSDGHLVPARPHGKQDKRPRVSM
jgi:uncharacterized membrane protein YgcG